LWGNHDPRGIGTRRKENRFRIANHGLHREILEEDPRTRYIPAKAETPTQIIEKPGAGGGGVPNLGTAGHGERVRFFLETKAARLLNEVIHIPLYFNSMYPNGGSYSGLYPFAR